MSVYVQGIPATDAAKQLGLSMDEVVHLVRTHRLLLSREDVAGMVAATELAAARHREAQQRQAVEYRERILKWARIARTEITAHGRLGPDPEPGR